jgi:hypothetical protein
MVDMIEEMNWAFHGEEARYRTLPGNDKLLSQLLLVYDGRDLGEFVNREYQRTRIALNLNVHGANAIGEVTDAIRAHLQQHPIPGLKAEIAGYGRLFADMQDLLVIGQIQSFGWAFVLIFVLLVLLWRSPTAALICLIPNLAPLYFIIVVMGITGIPLDMATSVIAGVVLGITVDDTIHLSQLPAPLATRREPNLRFSAQFRGFGPRGAGDHAGAGQPISPDYRFRVQTDRQFRHARCYRAAFWSVAGTTAVARPDRALAQSSNLAQ